MEFRIFKVGPYSFPTSLGTSFLLCFVVDDAFPWSEGVQYFMSKALKFKIPWKRVPVSILLKRRESIYVLIAPFILRNSEKYHPLSSWCGKSMSIFQNFHASKLSCRGYPHSMWQTSRDILTSQYGGTVHATQKHFVFQKCHLKMNSLGKWFWLIEILRWFFFPRLFCVSLSSIIVGKIFCCYCCLWEFFFPSVLQLRKCLPSLEINLGSWPPCCKISYNTAVSIGQFIDMDIFPPACIRSLGLWPIVSARALCAAWSVSKVPAIFFPWLYTDFLLWWKTLL